MVAPANLATGNAAASLGLTLKNATAPAETKLPNTFARFAEQVDLSLDSVQPAAAAAAGDVALARYARGGAFQSAARWSTSKSYGSRP